MPERSTRRWTQPLLAAVTAAAGAAFAVAGGRATAPPCEPGNGGITLPPGFCASIIVEGLGPLRHIAAAPNGDLFVAVRDGRGQHGGIVALHDSNGDGRMDVQRRFGGEGTTGIALYDGYLYAATTRSVIRYKLATGQLEPSGPAETIVADLPEQREHADKSFAFDGRGGLYVNVGAPSNACQPRDRTPKVPGEDPCPLLEEHGGIWKFDASRSGQRQSDGTRYATGMRQMIALAWHDGSLYAVMHNRDQLDTLWPGQFTADQNAELPAEAFLKVDEGANFGWPYCYLDSTKHRLLLNPEYGGDGTKVGRCDRFTQPLLGFPGHWAPNDLLFYAASQFPRKYRGGAFIAFHGSWNRAPLPQRGYNVAFLPFSGGKPAGGYEVFADGFAGRNPLARPTDAAARPDGLAVGPDGSLLVTDDIAGRIWRISYTGK
jgi:glucose/arabinose dehydrogenase